MPWLLVTIYSSRARCFCMCLDQNALYVGVGVSHVCVQGCSVTHDPLCCRVWVVQCRENDDDSAAFLANLRAGKYKALVLDAPVIDMWVAENTNCDLFAVGDR